MNILAIDTSCDETSAAVTNGLDVLSNVVSSQVRYHKKFGGVVPFLAQRLHKERIDTVVSLALEKAGLAWTQIDAVAVTYGPGLAPALQVGVAKAKELALTCRLPLYAVNHMAGHIASCYANVGSKKGAPVQYPTLAVLTSGNHTEWVYMEKPGSFHVVGQTLDDALGEAYDKVGRMLGLGYPGGHVVAKLAKGADPTTYPLPIPMQRSGDLQVSYSGLKNAVRLLIEAQQPLDQAKIASIAASFEYSAQKALFIKVEKALSQYPAQSLIVAGGVAANLQLRKGLRAIAKKHGMSFSYPSHRLLCTDNAGMIGVAAHFGIEAGQVPVDLETLDRKPALTLDETSNIS